MTADFTSIERAHFDQAATWFSKSQRTLDTLRYQILQSPIRQSYVGWLNAVRAVKPEHPARILDYCAGLGVHTITLQNEFPEAEVVAVDISQKALEVGRETAQGFEPGKKRPTFLPMDAHALSFPDAHFDLVSEFGSLSSLEFDRAMDEVLRVLRKRGTFIAVETFGHNPLANLKRRLNVLRGTRTQWCSSHIFDTRCLAKLRERFVDVQVEYHILFSLLLGALPFRSQRLSSLCGRLDSWLLNRLGLCRKYAFKVVVTARKPG